MLFIDTLHLQLICTYGHALLDTVILRQSCFEKYYYNINGSSTFLQISSCEFRFIM